MSLVVSLSPDHSAFDVELPSGVTTRISAEAFPATLRRLLIEQKRAQLDEDNKRAQALQEGRTLAQIEHWKLFGVGTGPSPTDHQRWHDEKHQMFPVDTCPFCKAEGRAKPQPARRAAGIVRRVGDVEIRHAAKTFSLEDIS